MIELEYEMTYAETIEGPLGPTGSPLGERLCWQVTNATLRGPRIDAGASRCGAIGRATVLPIASARAADDLYDASACDGSGFPAA